MPFALRCLILELQQGFVAEPTDSKYFTTDLFFFEHSTDLVVPERLKERLQVLSAMLERVLGIDILIGKLAVIDVVEVVAQVLLVEAGGAAAQAALVDRVAEHVGDRYVQKDGARGHLEEELVHLVVGWSKKIIAFRHMYRIAECLLIRVSPGPIDAVNNRSPSEHFQHHLVRQ